MLRVGVLASITAEFERVTSCLTRLDAGERDVNGDPGSGISVRGFEDVDPRSFSLVIGTGTHPEADSGLADVWLSTGDDHRRLDEAVETLWHRRIMSFDRNLRSGVRAPRLRRAVIVDSDRTWPDQARRLIGRLDFALGDRADRIDHVGSTSVPGLPAKDLIDIQVVVADLDTAARAATAAMDAGFVHVSGVWFGPGSEGRSHREEVCVDADPGRPVNVNIRPGGSPVWRDTLLLRDWLRKSAEGRSEYTALKRSLAERADVDIDGYGDAKASWVSSALARAGQSAASETDET